LSRTKVKGQTIIDDVAINGVESIKIPSGTTAERPITSLAGQIRFNTTDNKFEGYDGTTWAEFGSGSQQGGGSQPGDIDGDVTVEKHTGDNITTNFVMNTTVLSANSVQVDINGVLQEPDVAYTVNLVSSYITFTDPPATGDRITFKYLRELGNNITTASALSTSAFAGNITETDDADKVLIFDVSSNSVQAVKLEDLGVGGEGKWSVVSNTYTAKKGERVGVNSTSQAFTVTLPSTTGLSVGSSVAFADAGGYLTSNNVTIDGNGATITNLYNLSANTFILDQDGASIGMFWTGTTWRTY
tara:strand:- start:2172 stop:3074 length:903 start_codon:yes stop_codon:yes gene_type:complete